MSYEKFHVADISIDDEQRSDRGRGISVYVDTHAMVNIEFDHDMTIRTDEQGLEALRHLLSDASVRLDQVRHDYIANKMYELTQEMNPVDYEAIKRVKADESARSDQHGEDPYENLPNDPTEW